MKQVTVMGMYLKPTDCMGRDDGGTGYGNYLGYPGVILAKKLSAMGFSLHSESELPPEKAEIVLCIDLTAKLLERIRALPEKTIKVLIAMETVITAPLSHDGRWVVPEPFWHDVLTWNRSFESPAVHTFDIPVAGADVSERLPLHPPCTSGTGAVVVTNTLNYAGTLYARQNLFRNAAAAGMVDIFGKAWPVSPKRHMFGQTDDKLKVLHEHAYCLIIENTWAPGYVTEKLPDGILAGVPSVYWGDFETAERRFPGTFVRLREISAAGLNDAVSRLFADYGGMLKNIARAREESVHWCDSYYAAAMEVFQRLR